MQIPFNKYLFVIITFIVMGRGALAQEEEGERSSFKFDPSKIYIGGSLGADFTSNSSLIDISPLIGYRFTDKFIAGPGLIYRYLSIADIQTHNYGVKFFSRYFIQENIFAHGEYEFLDWQPIYTDGSTFYTNRRKKASSLLLGGGYSQPLGGSATLNVMLLLEVLNDPNSPYRQQSSPFVFRVGIGL